MENPNIKELYYFKNIIKNDIVNILDGQEWEPITESKNSRKVQHYGFKYGYKSHSTTQPTIPMIPCIEELKTTLTTICKDIFKKDYNFNQ